MNPLTNVKNLQKLNQRELELGLTNKKSWHDKYKDSAWIFVGGLPYDLTEGDIVCVFSQYGEIVNINLVRDKSSGKSKGFCFLCYEDQRSTILAVDNLNSIKLLGRTLRVDHVEEYKKPKEHGDEDETTLKLRADGCAPQVPQSPERVSDDEEPLQVKVKAKKEKKLKKEKKSKKKKKKKVAARSSSSSSESESDSETDYRKYKSKNETETDFRKHKIKREKEETDYRKHKIKVEKPDPGYDRAENSKAKRTHSPDFSDERSKYSKYDRNESDYRNYADNDKYRDTERDKNKERDRERYQRTERDTDRSRSRDGEYGRIRENNGRDFDRNSSKNYRDERDDNYHGNSSKYERRNDRFSEEEREYRSRERYNDRDRSRDYRR